MILITKLQSLCYIRSMLYLKLHIFSVLLLIATMSASTFSIAQASLVDFIGMSPTQEREFLIHEASLVIKRLPDINPAASEVVQNSAGVIIFPRVSFSRGGVHSMGVVFVQNIPVGIVKYDEGVMRGLGYRPHTLILAYVNGVALSAVQRAGSLGVSLKEPLYQVWSPNIIGTPMAWAIALDGNRLLHNYTIGGTITAQ